MKNYLLPLATGAPVGVIDALLRVKSPAPPAIAQIGLLIGEQLVSVAVRMFRGDPVASFIRHGCTKEIRRSSAAPPV